MAGGVTVQRARHAGAVHRRRGLRHHQHPRRRRRASARKTRRRRSRTAWSARRRSARSASRWRFARFPRWSSTRGSPCDSRRDAWLITFTNPVSVVTQAVRQETGARDHRHLRHADRDLRGCRARARPAGDRVRLRLLRPESPRLAARGDLPGRAADGSAVERRRAARVRLSRPALRDGAAARSAAAAERVSLLLLPARDRAGPFAARGHEPRRAWPP